MLKTSRVVSISVRPGYVLPLAWRLERDHDMHERHFRQKFLASKRC